MPSGSNIHNIGTSYTSYTYTFTIRNNVLHKYALNIHELRIDKRSPSSQRVVASRVAIIIL